MIDRFIGQVVVETVHFIAHQADLLAFAPLAVVLAASDTDGGIAPDGGVGAPTRPAPSSGRPRVPAYESDVLSNSLKSFGLPLPRLAFMHWPTKKPMTFWLPSRYCCA